MSSEKNTPAVSIVIAAYNAERWIEETLERVLAQTYQDFEIVVADDDSTDRTADIVEQYSSPVRLVRREENGGSAAARNTGIRAARGRYVAFLDADDLWLPEKLQRQMQILEAHPEVDWCYTDALIIDAESGEARFRAGRANVLREGNVLRPLLMANFIPFSSILARTEALEAIGGFNESPLHRISEDWDFCLRMAGHAPVRCVRAPLVRKRQHRRQKTETMDLTRALRSWQAIIDRAVRTHPDQLADLHDRSTARICFRIGRKMLDREARPEARRVLAQGLRCAPLSLNLWTYWTATFLPRPVLRVLGRLRARCRRLLEDEVSPPHKS